MQERALKPRIAVRTTYLALLAVSWGCLVVLMWQAFRTLPSAQALADARHVPPPLPRDLLLNIVTSFGELLFVFAVLWPWWRHHYIWRGLAAALALMAWFLFTVPLQINNMIWLHRRWLAFLIMSLIVAIVIATVSVVVQKEVVAPADN